MHPPVLDPVSSFEVNITWKAPDPVSEVRGQVVMYQVILTRNNTSGNPFAPPTEDVVSELETISCLFQFFLSRCNRRQLFGFEDSSLPIYLFIAINFIIMKDKPHSLL